MHPGRLTGLAAAVLVTAAAGLVGVTYGAPPAAAGTCSSTSGVTVVVDFQQLGGGVQGSCVADGAGERADSLFPEAGFPLDYVQSEPGFVCRVAGLPAATDEACNDTPPDTAYWGLWWSDGTSGTWSYSNYGVGSLKVPDGGYVAFSWKQGGGSASAPGVAPSPHAATVSPTAGPTAATGPAKPTPTAKPRPTSKPDHPASVKPRPASTSDPTTSAASSSPSSSPSSSASTRPTGAVPTSPGQSATTSASAVASSAASPTSPASGVVVSDPRPTRASSPAAASGGLPVWLVVLVVAALFAAAGVLALLRRRRGGGADVRGGR